MTTAPHQARPRSTARRNALAGLAGLLPLATLACGKSGSSGAQPSASASASASLAVASASASAVASAPPSKLGSFAGSLEGRPFSIGGAKVVPMANYLHVVLSTGPLDCDKSSREEDVVLEADFAPGPGGKFLAGQKQGVPVRWTAKQPFKWSQATPYQTIGTLEPFKLAAGETLKGTLEFSLRHVVPTDDAGARVYEAKGTFEAPICPDPSGFKTLIGTPEDAGTEPFGGTFGGQKFTYKKALAIVFKDLRSSEEYVESIQLYDDDSITCQNRYDEDKKRKARYVSFTSIGGAGASHVLGGAQSADASFSSPGGKGAGAKWQFFARRRAWVKLDKYAFKAGETLTGSLYAETTVDAKPEEAGKMQGRFEAKICNLGW
jgi:hypothetical protein